MNNKICVLQRQAIRLHKMRYEEVTKSITIRDIVRAVCIKLNVPIDKVESKSRKQELVLARKISAYLACQSERYSLKEIGLALGGRDHTTIIHNRESVVDMLQTSPSMREKISFLHKEIYGKPILVNYKILA